MLLAAARGWADFTNRLPSTWEMLAIAFITGLMIWGIFRLRAWLSDDDDPAAAERQLLLQLNEMTREGELSEDEYRLLKRRLGVSVSKTMSGTSSSSVKRPMPAEAAAETGVIGDRQQVDAQPPVESQSVEETEEQKSDEQSP